MKEFKFVKKPSLHESGEYPTFNECDHLLIDLSDIQGDTENWMNTLSIKLPDGKYVTLCVMDLGDSINIDAQFHGHKETKVIGFDKGVTKSVKNMNLYALIGYK